MLEVIDEVLDVIDEVLDVIDEVLEVIDEVLEVIDEVLEELSNLGRLQASGMPKAGAQKKSRVAAAFL